MNYRTVEKCYRSRTEQQKATWRVSGGFSRRILSLPVVVVVVVVAVMLKMLSLSPPIVEGFHFVPTTTSALTTTHSQRSIDLRSSITQEGTPFAWTTALQQQEQQRQRRRTLRLVDPTTRLQSNNQRSNVARYIASSRSSSSSITGSSSDGSNTNDGRNVIVVNGSNWNSTMTATATTTTTFSSDVDDNYKDAIVMEINNNSINNNGMDIHGWQNGNTNTERQFSLSDNNKNDNGIETTTTTKIAAAGVSTSTSTGRIPFYQVIWKFTRPHTLIGSALAVPALHLFAAPTISSMLTISTFYSILYATIPSLLMNLYITGLNQITDVEIDKINKPQLPIAAGILQPRTAMIVCCVALITSLLFGSYGHPIYCNTNGLLVALWGSGILGTLYSVEPFRLKRYPLLAAFCIVAVRGTIINASFFAHAMVAAYHQLPATTTVLSCLMHNTKCLYSSIFFGIYGMVIAFMKDVPDVLGDTQSNVRTFSVRIGPTKMFYMSRNILISLFSICSIRFIQTAISSFVSSIATTTSSILVGTLLCRTFMSLSCMGCAYSIYKQSKHVDTTNPKQVYDYYMHLWKIFYLSYVLLPFAR